MIFFLPILLLLPVLSYADEIRPELTSTASEYLNHQIPETKLIEKLKAQKSLSQFDEAERLYLEDLTKKLPESLREELCPSFEEGLCTQAPDFKIWEEVPKLVDHSNPPSSESWIARNKLWLTGIAIGAIGLSAYQLRNKEIQVGFSNH